MSGIASLISLFKSQTNGAADGTGTIKLTEKAKALLGDNLPQSLVDYTLSIQLSIFGDYPSGKDIAPSAIFMAVFLIFTAAHLFVFFKDYSRGHKFWLSLLFSFYNLLRTIGWLLRIVWADDILKMEVGIASSVFIITPIVILASLNLVLAQRIFTWRHPHVGSSKLFWIGMITVYIIVAGVLATAIVGAVVPYVYFLSESHFNMCKRTVRAAAVICVLYSVLAMTLVIVAYLFKPTGKSQSIVTYQPWWIESFAPTYYVPKGAARRAEESFKSRDQDFLSHVRVIASTTQHHNTIERVQTVTSKSGKLDHNYSIFIIFITTIILLISLLFRCVSTFIAHERADQSWIFEPVVQYVMFGVLETIVNVIYLVGRVDLRFYRPDKLNKNIVGLPPSNSSQESEKLVEVNNGADAITGESHIGDETLHSSNEQVDKTAVTPFK